MVLLSFSTLYHIEKIKNGSKHQTTRVPRKPHKNGSPAYKVGDKVQLYYHSRQIKSCSNCIQDKDTYNLVFSERYGRLPCKIWSNFFGESMIVRILHYQYGPYFENGTEIWKGYNLSEADMMEKEKWAVADGFTSWAAANQWFKKSTQSEWWAHKPLDVIIWDSTSIVQKWKNMR